MKAEDLKASILQMAIQGKLVPQDPNDESASILLEKIREEKKQLVKEGKIKKDKNDSFIFKRDNHYYENLNGKEVCIDDEIPFEIPDNWTWTRIGNIINIVRGGSPRPISKYISSSEDGYNWIKIGDSEIDGKFITSCRQRIIKEGLSKTRFVHAGDFLLTNSMSYGRPYILKIDGCIHDGWLALTDQFDVYNQDYLYHLLKSSAVREQIDNLVAGSVVNNLNKDKVGTILVPLLSKSEQLHIVSIIEELGVIVNELKQSIELLNHIDSTVGKKLFASTLRGAIQGKLVPQDPSEQPVVIDCKNPIIRRDNSYYEVIGKDEVCIDDEVPFEIPESWCWIRLKELGGLKRGNGIKRSDLVKEGMPCIRYGELYTTYSIKTDEAHSFINEELFQQRSHLHYGDLLITLTGETKEDIGKTIAFIGNCNVAFGGDLACLSNHKQNPLFISYCLNSPYCVMKKSSLSNGDQIIHLRVSKLERILIPIPPLDEQNRIVQAIEHIIGLTSQLSY